MDFSVFRGKLVAGGYSDDTADAKIAWLDVPAEAATSAIIAFISSME